MKNFLIGILFIVVGCMPFDDSGSWTGSNNQIRVNFGEGWAIASAMDFPEETMCCLIKAVNFENYMVDIDRDSPEAGWSDDAYYALLEKRAREQDNRNRLLGEGDCMFHGQKYHYQNLLLYAPFVPLRKTVIFTKRSKKEQITVQMTFLTNMKTYETDTISNDLLQLDQQVKIYGK